jgi:RNA polymerase sigma-70 factor (sigma-E family)
MTKCNTVPIERQFEDIVRRSASRLRRTAFLLVGNWTDAEDLVQSTLVRAVRYKERICEVEAPAGYLKQILIRTCIDERRKRRVTEHATDDLPDTMAPDDSQDEKWAVRSALAKVPRSQREILILRFYADLSVAETAAALGCSIGNVKSQTSRGLDALARSLERASRDEAAWIA